MPLTKALLLSLAALTSAFALTVSPSSATLYPTTTQVFTSSGSDCSGVSWSVSGPGSVDSNGNYTAPTTLAAPTSATTGLLVRRRRSVSSGKNQKFVYEYSVDTGLLRGLRELEKHAAIEMGQWTEKSHVKMDANVNQNSQILAATFTIEELERMANAGVKAAEREQQQQQQPVTIAAHSSREDAAEQDINPDVPEWMR